MSVVVQCSAESDRLHCTFFSFHFIELQLPRHDVDDAGYRTYEFVPFRDLGVHV